MNLRISTISKPFRGLYILIFLFFVQQGYSQNIQQWYDDAQERIDTLRKGSFGMEIYDKNGQPYTGPVKVRMAKHEFPFGIAFDFYEGEIQTDVPTETQWMKAAMYKYFNYGVSGNSFKWSGIDPNGNGPDYTNFENALNWTQKVGWELRAHTLLWGGSEGDNHAMPQWVTNLGSAEAVFQECEERVRREVSRYKGLVKEYDVINEPLHATYTQDLYGDSLNWKSFEWAREEDPDAELFINEYNVEYGWGDTEEYVNLIEEIIAKGAPVTGIGIQAHFWDCCRPDVTDLVTQINKIAEVGLPIRLTEYDYGGDLTEAQQAEDFIKVATIAFSHPSINGMICWGLSDLGAWRENTGFFTEDHKPKLAADTLQYLTKELWATNFDSTATAGEVMHFDAYYGDYIVEVSFGETVKQFTIPCLTANEDSVFQLHEDEGAIKGPELIAAQFSSLDEVELTFDEPIDPSSIDKYDFRVFTANDIFINGISVKEGADSVLVFDLSSNVEFNDYPTVSYFPGSLLSDNGGVAPAFGTEAISISAVLNEEPLLRDQSFDLKEGIPAGHVVGTVIASDPEGESLSYEIIAGNSSGAFSIDPSTGKLKVASPALIDHESNPVFDLTVEVSDGIHAVTAAITINVDVVLAVEEFDNNGLLIYPNPAKHVLNVSSQTLFQRAEIYDLGGKLLYRKDYQDPVNEDVLTLNLKSGVYFLKIATESDVKTSKVVID